MINTIGIVAYRNTNNIIKSKIGHILPLKFLKLMPVHLDINAIIYTGVTKILNIIMLGIPKQRRKSELKNQKKNDPDSPVGRNHLP